MYAQSRIVVAVDV